MKTLYHGTSVENFQSILKTGLLAKKNIPLDKLKDNWEHTSPSWDGGVYLTSVHALHFARSASFIDDETSFLYKVIIEVEVDEDDLLPDEDYLAHLDKLNIRKDVCVTLLANSYRNKIENIENAHLSQESLQDMGTCIKKGDISFENIKRVTFVKIPDRMSFRWSDFQIGIRGFSYLKPYYEALNKLCFGDFSDAQIDSIEGLDPFQKESLKEFNQLVERLIFEENDLNSIEDRLNCSDLSRISSKNDDIELATKLKELIQSKLIHNPFVL